MFDNFPTGVPGIDMSSPAEAFIGEADDRILLGAHVGSLTETSHSSLELEE